MISTVIRVDKWAGSLFDPAGGWHYWGKNTWWGHKCIIPFLWSGCKYGKPTVPRLNISWLASIPDTIITQIYIQTHIHTHIHSYTFFTLSNRGTDHWISPAKYGYHGNICLEVVQNIYRLFNEMLLHQFSSTYRILKTIVLKHGDEHVRAVFVIKHRSDHIKCTLCLLVNL